MYYTGIQGLTITVPNLSFQRVLEQRQGRETRFEGATGPICSSRACFLPSLTAPSTQGWVYGAGVGGADLQPQQFQDVNLLNAGRASWVSVTFLFLGSHMCLVLLT